MLISIVHPESPRGGSGGGSVRSEISGYVARWKFDEAGGDLATDQSGHHPGTLISSPVRIPGVSGGRALQFSSGSYVRVPAHQDFNFSESPYTISMWVRLAASQTAWAGVISKGSLSTTGWTMSRNNATGDVRMYHNNSFATHAGLFAAITGSAWRHLVMTYDGVTSRSYLDKILYASGTVPAPLAAAGPLQIGGSRAPTTINGDLDDVRVYNRVLSLAEIKLLSSGG